MLRQAVRCDVAVIGGGLLGLSTALSLAERGASVALFESQQPGFGASGRNTGVVAPALKGTLTLEQVSKRLGPEPARRLFDLVVHSGAGLFALVDRLGLACAAEPSGLLQPAPTQASLAAVERQVRELEPFGAGPVLLDAAQMAQRTGITGYRGALLLPGGGQINPLAYTRGLATAAAAAGAALYCARVTGLTRQGSSWRLATADGADVTADSVVATTNALNGGLIPTVERSLIPVRVYQVATQPLGEAVRRRLLVGRQPLVDLRNHPFALRWSPDHRLVTGGGGLHHDGGAVERMGRFFLRRLRAMVPDLPALAPDYAWTGIIAGTGDFLPRVWDLGHGLLAPIGCNGRGVALTTALGHAVATYLLERRPERLAVPLSAPKPWRLHQPMRLASSVWLAQARLKDWRNDHMP